MSDMFDKRRKKNENEEQTQNSTIIFIYLFIVNLLRYFPSSFFTFGVGEGGSFVTDFLFIFFLMLQG